jgi:hypothetical protein
MGNVANTVKIENKTVSKGTTLGREQFGHFE